MDLMQTTLLLTSIIQHLVRQTYTTRAEEEFANQEMRSELLIDNCLQEQYEYSKNKDCRCYLFQSNGYIESGELFKTPFYPTPYPRGINCIVYTFLGDVGEIVEINFWNFQMRPRYRGRCLDYLQLFLQLDRTELSESDEADYHLCGNMSDLPQTKFYSSGRVLMMMFHSETNPLGIDDVNVPRYPGFVGQYRFINSEQFRMQPTDHPRECTWTFRFSSPQSRKPSLESQSNKLSNSKNRFFSPKYPQNYPGGSLCYYTFIGLPNQRVVITFEHLHLEDPMDGCGPDTTNDHILVIEGAERKGSILARLCTSERLIQVVSHGPSTLVIFRSNNNARSGQGFSGTWQFVYRSQVEPTPFLANSSFYSIDGETNSDSGPAKLVRDEEDKTLISGKKRNISRSVFDFHSTRSHIGNILSPNYPKAYPTSSEILYKIAGVGEEKVELFIDDLQLDTQSNNNCRQYTRDRLEIYDGISDLALLHTVLCGRVNNLTLISKGPYFTLKFLTDGDTLSTERGFKITYRFFTPLRSDGQYSTTQSSTEKGMQCGDSIYGSVSKHSIGEIRSPNFPSGYPPNINCSWKLYGRLGERILLRFLSFNLASEDSPDSMKKVCKGGDQLEIYTYLQRDNAMPIVADSMKFCGRDKTFSVMSASHPRLDIIFTSGQGNVAQRNEHGFIFQYRFIRGQCDVDIVGERTLSGNVSSPNYPGVYPSDITCNYRFYLPRGYALSLHFHQFEIESVSNKCLDQYGDYITASHCTLSTDISPLNTHNQYDNLPLRSFDGPRWCRRTPPEVDTWKESPCLQLTFRSDDRFVRAGFLATYRFTRVSDNQAERRWTSNESIFTIFTCSFAHFLLLQSILLL